MLAITRDDVTLLLALLLVASGVQYAYLGVNLRSVFQNCCIRGCGRPDTRCLQVVYGLVGQGLGTLLVGTLSDRLAPRFGEAAKA
jgi:hypothetical protein